MGREREIKLYTIETNSRPRRGWRGRNKTDEKRERRREKRKERRTTRGRKEEMKKEEMKIVTWNLQSNRRRLRRVIGYMEKRGWQVVLMTEIKAETQGILWLVEQENQVAIVHGKMMAVALRGAALRGWTEGGQIRRFAKRTATVEIGEVKLVAAFQPLWSNDREGVENYRTELEQELAMGRKEQITVMGGDHNVKVGRGAEVEGTRGKYGMNTPTNEAGEDLVNWCQENGMAYLNSFSAHRRRGTWFNIPRGTWNELDGFIMTKEQRHRHMRGMKVLEETGLSNHKSVQLRITLMKKKWRQVEGRRKQVRHEKLKDRRTQESFREKVR